MYVQNLPYINPLLRKIDPSLNLINTKAIFLQGDVNAVRDQQSASVDHTRRSLPI
jgi:hypothetical protein